MNVDSCKRRGGMAYIRRNPETICTRILGVYGDTNLWWTHLVSRSTARSRRGEDESTTGVQQLRRTVVGDRWRRYPNDGAAVDSGIGPSHVTRRDARNSPARCTSTGHRRHPSLFTISGVAKSRLPRGRRRIPRQTGGVAGLQVRKFGPPTTTLEILPTSLVVHVERSADCVCVPVTWGTRRPASADRTARRQFQATVQPVSRTQLTQWRHGCRAIIIFLGDHALPLTGSNFGNLTAFRAIFSHIFTAHAQERPFMTFG